MLRLNNLYFNYKFIHNTDLLYFLWLQVRIILHILILIYSIISTAVAYYKYNWKYDIQGAVFLEYSCCFQNLLGVTAVIWEFEKNFLKDLEKIENFQKIPARTFLARLNRKCLLYNCSNKYFTCVYLTIDVGEGCS